MNIREAYINYFTKNKHQYYESSSLIPAEDKSLLFTNSGMVQFKDFFLGIKEPSAKRIVTCQKCVRAGGKHNDLENIGFTNRHHSFFEMLGNFSFGDYFKEEAIVFAWDFLTKELCLPKEKLFISIHKDDSEAFTIWNQIIGINKNKIWLLDDADNFWQMGSTGPCGPCTEIYYDYGDKFKGSTPIAGDPGDRYVEIWNLVFTQYNRDSNGKLHDLPMKCVDTGMGLERIHAVVEGKSDNYKTTLFSDLDKFVDDSIGKKKITKSIKKIIMDHSRSACLLISDGVIPGNDGRGYVLRRIIRRATRYLYNIGILEPSIFKSIDIISSFMGGTYPNLINKKNMISETLLLEEKNYLDTLEKGLTLIDKITKKSNTISGEEIFKLYDTYGFPREITEEIAREKGFKLDLMGFKKLMELQKQRSKESNNFRVDENDSELSRHDTTFIGYDQYKVKSNVLDIIYEGNHLNEMNEINSAFNLVIKETVFYPEGGGQISDIGSMWNDHCKIEILDVKKLNGTIIHLAVLKEGIIRVEDTLNQEIDSHRRSMITINHSATHLMHQALREVLGSHVEQKGSLVSENSLRFDFSHNKQLNDQQLDDIEMIVTNEITQSIKTKIKQMKFKEAIKMGALAFFDEKYGEDVRVLFIGNNSIELCGGTHVKSTDEIRLFKVISENSISTGVRRIEAVTADGAFRYFRELSDMNKSISHKLNTNQSNLPEKITSLIKLSDTNKKEIISLNKKVVQLYALNLNYKTVGTSKIYIHHCKDLTTDQMKLLSDELKSKSTDSISILFKQNMKTINCVISVSKKCKHSYNSKKIIEEFKGKFDCKGGGSATFGSLVLTDEKVEAVESFILKLF